MRGLRLSQTGVLTFALLGFTSGAAATQDDADAGYEGLSAMTFQLPTGSGQWDITGVLFPGSMPKYPPFPEPSATEAAE